MTRNSVALRRGLRRLLVKTLARTLRDEHLSGTGLPDRRLLWPLWGRWELQALRGSRNDINSVAVRYIDGIPLFEGIDRLDTWRRLRLSLPHLEWAGSRPGPGNRPFSSSTAGDSRRHLLSCWHLLAGGGIFNQQA